MAEKTSRVDAEWVALSAFRGLLKIASKGDPAKSTYDNALDLGGEVYPELLGPEKSVLRRERESDTTREYRQKAQLLSIKNNEQIAPLNLIREDVEEMKELLAIAERTEHDRTRVDQLKKKLRQLVYSEREMNPVPHFENQLIFRDAYNVERNLPSIEKGHGYRDFRLPDDNVLRGSSPAPGQARTHLGSRYCLRTARARRGKSKHRCRTIQNLGRQDTINHMSPRWGCGSDVVLPHSLRCGLRIFRWLRQLVECDTPT